VSANPVGTVIDGGVCGLSAYGGKILFRSRNGSFGPEQLFMKDFNGKTSTDLARGSKHALSTLRPLAGCHGRTGQHVGEFSGRLGCRLPRC
jgi:hypothetical protein